MKAPYRVYESARQANGRLRNLHAYIPCTASGGGRSENDYVIHENHTAVSLSFSMADRLGLNNDEFSSTGGGGASVDSASVGETDSGLSI